MSKDSGSSSSSSSSSYYFPTGLGEFQWGTVEQGVYRASSSLLGSPFVGTIPWIGRGTSSSSSSGGSSGYSSTEKGSNYGGVPFKTVLLLSSEISKSQLISLALDQGRTTLIHLGISSLQGKSTSGGHSSSASASATSMSLTSGTALSSLGGGSGNNYSAAGTNFLSSGGGSGGGINYLTAMSTTTSWRPVPDEVIKEGLQVILNVDAHPLLICCSSGLFETGVMIGCLRKLQGWNFNSIVVEYRSWAGSKSKYGVEQFIELFDVDLVTLPQSLPTWFNRHDPLQLQLRQQQQVNVVGSSTLTRNADSFVRSPEGIATMARNSESFSSASAASRGSNSFRTTVAAAALMHRDSESSAGSGDVRTR